MSPSSRRRNLYRHEIGLDELTIKNKPKDAFQALLERVQYRGYEVEQLVDGRKVVITKPGGKSTYGKIRREDFMVWIYNSTDLSLWLISHKDIYADLEEKGAANPCQAIDIIGGLERVYQGEEPDDVLRSTPLPNPCGELPDLILKAYKWIWGQEDCNYPDGLGRAMSWEGWAKDKSGKLQKTGTGITDLRDRLKASL